MIFPSKSSSKTNHYTKPFPLWLIHTNAFIYSWAAVQTIQQNVKMASICLEILLASSLYHSTKDTTLHSFVLPRWCWDQKYLFQNHWKRLLYLLSPRREGYGMNAKQEAIKVLKKYRIHSPFQKEDVCRIAIFFFGPKKKEKLQSCIRLLFEKGCESH